MTIDISLFDLRDCEDYNLQDYSDYSDKVHCCNQLPDGESLKGSWYYVSDAPLVNRHGTFRVIYAGSFGNYNSPGADAFTKATLYDTEDLEDMQEFKQDVIDWKAIPEYLDVDE